MPQQNLQKGGARADRFPMIHSIRVTGQTARGDNINYSLSRPKRFTVGDSGVPAEVFRQHRGIEMRHGEL
jgi:hypothetical protein